MTTAQRADYERTKASRIEELHAIAQGHMDAFDECMREIDKLESETFEDAYADDRSKEHREEMEERRQQQTEGGVS